MRAVVLAGPEDLRVESVPDPVARRTPATRSCA